MKACDIIAEPCQCPECRQAGMTTTERRRDPQTGRLLHGYELKRWVEARERFLTMAKRAGISGAVSAKALGKLAKGME